MFNMNNVILLPGAIKQLQQQADEAIQKQQFEEACEALQALVDHKVGSHEDLVNLLACLMKLKRLDDAEQYCLYFLDNSSDATDQFHEVFELYMMVLFEMNDFSEVMTLIKEISEQYVPEGLQEKYQALYTICYEQNELIGKDVLHQFDQAIKEENHKKQSDLLYDWLTLMIEPNDDLANYVQLPEILPSIKTRILLMLMEHQYSQPVKVEKFGNSKTVHPNQLLPVHQETSYSELLLSIQSIEQNNPTLFNVITELIHQYCYVMYPFNVDEKNIASLESAFLIIGKQHLSLETTENEDDAMIKVFIKNIHICSQLYSILED